MKITITSTAEKVTLANGELVRVWNGTTEAGVPVQVLVAGLAIDKPDEARFRAELGDVDDAPQPIAAPLAGDPDWTMQDTLQSTSLATGAANVLGWMWQKAELRHRAQALLTLAFSLSHYLTPAEHAGLVQRLTLALHNMRQPHLVDGMRSLASRADGAVSGRAVVCAPPGAHVFQDSLAAVNLAHAFERAFCHATCGAGMSRDDLMVTLAALVGRFLFHHTEDDAPDAELQHATELVMRNAIQARNIEVHARRRARAEAQLRGAEVQGHA